MFRTGVEESDQAREPTNYVGDFAVLEVLGAGAFGCVYRVRKGGSGRQFAMKEVISCRWVHGQSWAHGQCFPECRFLCEEQWWTEGMRGASLGMRRA
jgi:hypothetical protein